MTNNAKLRDDAIRLRTFAFDYSDQLDLADRECIERAAARAETLAARDPDELREALVEVSTALQLLIERQGEHIFELPGATGVSDLDRADRALGKARTALSRNVGDVG